MAESLDANSTVPTAPVRKKSGPNPILEGISSFLRITTWFVVGLVFLFLGVICKVKRPIPITWESFFAQYIPHLPYFICGFGFLCLAHVRSLLRKDYVAEQKKDNFYPHAWKISLLGNQVFLLYASGIYAILFGLNIVPAIGMLGLVFFVACFFLYLLLYQVEYFKNRLPAFATLRISIMAFVFAGISFLLWTLCQMIVPSLIMAFLGILAGFYSLGYSGIVTQRGVWLKYLFMTATVALLGVVGYYALDLRNPQMEPLNTAVVTKGLRGDISGLVYSPQGDKIVFTQKLNDQWFIQVVSPENKTPVTFPLPGIEGPFHSIFLNDGNSLIIDGIQKENRELLKVDTNTGAITVLVKAGVEPFGTGASWLSSTHQFLFVTKTKKGFNLNCWTLGKSKTGVLYSSAASILSPSWIDAGDVAFVNGIDSTPYLLNLYDKSIEPLLTEDIEKETGELIENDPLIEVLPSPDNFRYLCVSYKDGKTTLWSMLMDGTKHMELYKGDDQLSDIAWSADGQKIIFEKNGLQKGFKHNIKGIVVLNANLGTSENLVPAQINVHSPAVSPDGIKIAFVGSEGLWYPSLDSGIWVSVLR